MLAILFLTIISDASNISLGEIIVRGQGCNSESTKITTKEKSIQVQFHDFEVQAGSGKKTLERKNCSVVVPVNVPDGYRISIEPPILEGKVNLEIKGSAQVSAETFLAGSQGAKSTKTLAGPLYSNFTTQKAKSQKQWSNCGETVNLRLNISAVAKVENPLAKATVKIEKFPEDIHVEKCLWGR